MSTSMDDFSIPFLESDANDDPFAQFQDWFDDVLRLDLPEPNAVVLATASAEGVPAARVVLLKGVDKDGFLFFTNYQSAKGRDLKENPAASLCFHWQDLRRQVRVQGTIKKAPRKVSESYFRSRPRGSQIGAWASPQSQEVPDRAELDKRVVETEERFASGDVPCPPHWGGYLLKPQTIEFWRHGGDRMHDRVVYERSGRAWAKRRVAP